MAGLDPAIHAAPRDDQKQATRPEGFVLEVWATGRGDVGLVFDGGYVDGRVKPGHDEKRAQPRDDDGQLTL
jgi:hypothetical protein